MSRERTDGEALYRKIFRQLRVQIEAGALVPTQRIPTELELSKIHGVSRITVGRAVRELEQRGYVHRVRGRGTFVNAPTAWAGGDAAGTAPATARLLSLVMPFRDREINFEIFHGVEEVCDERGFFPTFHNSMNDPKKEERTLTRLLEEHVRGVLVYPSSSFVHPGLYLRMQREGVPFVLLDRVVVGVDAVSVSIDHYASFRRLVEHLLELSHTRIAFVSSDTARTSTKVDRYRAYCDALSDSGISIPAGYVHHDFATIRNPTHVPHAAPSGPLRSNARRVLRSLLALERPPTAIAAINDHTAMLLVAEIRGHGLEIPHDISIAGFDDTSDAQASHMQLTTVRQDFREIGRRAASRLIDRMEGGSPDVPRPIPTELVVRRSTAAPPASPALDPRAADGP